MVKNEIYDCMGNLWNSGMVKLNKCINAISTAKKLCMTVVGEYDKSFEEYTNDMKNIAHYYIHKFDEIAKIF